MYNVLSLFDGISCGQLALNRANIPFENYYASEIDGPAILVTKNNHPKTTHIGSVTDIIPSRYNHIDILIGGSPCQGFSFAGKQLNFNDPRSSLFFEFIRIKDKINPKYFLLENVKMKKEFEIIITNYMGVEPIELNSNLVSKQNRKRLYWTNIPISEIKDKNLNFNNYLYRIGHGYIKDEIKFFKKYPSLAAQTPGSKYRIITNINEAMKIDYEYLRKDKNLSRVAKPEECEEFQTLPIGYTSCLNKTQRYKTIGNGWTVDIISEIFKNII